MVLVRLLMFLSSSLVRVMLIRSGKIPTLVKVMSLSLFQILVMVFLMTPRLLLL